MNSIAKLYILLILAIFLTSGCLINTSMLCTALSEQEQPKPQVVLAVSPGEKVLTPWSCYKETEKVNCGDIVPLFQAGTYKVRFDTTIRRVIFEAIK